MLFLCNVSHFYFCPLMLVDYWSPPLLLHRNLCLLLNPLIFNIARFPGIWCVYIYCHNFFLLNGHLYHYILSFLSVLMLFTPKSTISDIKKIIPVYVSCPFTWSIPFHILTLFLHIFLNEMCLLEITDGWVLFLIQSVNNLYFFYCMFKSFAFRVKIDLVLSL